MHTLTSHAIVGKSLTELIDHNEENADWIPKTLSRLYQHTLNEMETYGSTLYIEHVLQNTYKNNIFHVVILFLCF